MRGELISFLNFPLYFKKVLDNDEDFRKCLENEFKYSRYLDDFKIYNDLRNEDYVRFKRFSEIISNFHYYEIINMNSINSTACLIISNDKVDAKIHLLPNEKKNVIFYYSKDKYIDCIAFRRDFDDKEETVNIMGFNYTNNTNVIAPAHINLSDYIKISKN